MPSPVLRRPPTGPGPVAVLALLVLLACAILLPATARGDAYVALGDSYSSGLGAGEETDRPCRRSALAFPEVVAARRPGTTLDSVACAGATVPDVLATQLTALTPATGLVTLTVGGNDAGFTSVIVRCALPSWVARCGPPVTRARRVIRATLPRRLDRLYGEIRRRAPAARVVVAGYPRLFNGIDCGAATFFGPGDQRLLNGTADLLRDLLRERARAAGFAFADVAPAFRGHAVCDDPEWLNGLSSPLRESFHPNGTGHAEGYAAAVLGALAR
jgi:lysophospholipase L1-like esterase